MPAFAIMAQGRTVLSRQVQVRVGTAETQAPDTDLRSDCGHLATAGHPTLLVTFMSARTALQRLRSVVSGGSTHDVAHIAVVRGYRPSTTYSVCWFLITRTLHERELDGWRATNR